VLQDIAWPKETLVAFEIPTQGIMTIDVDLPEVEDMPDKTAMVPQRGFKLSVKEMGPTQVQRLYMRHVHAIDFGNLGQIDVVEAFARFDLRRDMSKTGVFKPIEPFAAPATD